MESAFPRLLYIPTGQHLDYCRDGWRAPADYGWSFAAIKDSSTAGEEPKWCSLSHLPGTPDWFRRTAPTADKVKAVERHLLFAICRIELRPFLGLLTHYGKFLLKWLQFWPLYRTLPGAGLQQKRSLSRQWRTCWYHCSW